MPEWRFSIGCLRCGVGTSHPQRVDGTKMYCDSMPCSQGMMAPARSGRGCDGWKDGMCQLKLTQLMNVVCVPWSPISGLLNTGWRGCGGAISHPAFIHLAKGNWMPWSPVSGTTQPSVMLLYLK